MTPAVIRLTLVTVLFTGWLGYLGYLVATRPATAEGRPLVVSRPQILTSEIDVIARIEAPGEPATIEEVLWPDRAPVAAGEKLLIERLDEAGALRRSDSDMPPADVTGPGRYLVPLRRSPFAQGKYEVAPIPPSPGFHGDRLPIRVYPATAEVLAQYRQVQKP